MSEETQKEEQQFVSLLLKHPDLVEDFNDSPLNMEYFDSANRMIIHAIKEAHENGVQLTRKSFLDFIGNIVAKKSEIARLEIAFNQISYTLANRNDYPMLKGKILNAYLLRQATQYVRDFAKNREEQSTIFAVQQLASSMTDLASNSKKGNKIIYEDLAPYGKEIYEEMLAVREGTAPPAEFISYGIEELDKTSGVGLAPGTMTLFAGDVGGFKSTMMMNVGLHVWYKLGYNVLYVPLEMPRALVYRKILSRQTAVPFDFITDPKTLTTEQIEKIRKYSVEDSINTKSKLYIMDSYEQRTSVGLIRRMIERNLEIFKPRVVIIDYIANLSPDKRADRPDMEIGEMLKDLRYMGRPGVVHDLGFATVSGVQIGREGLKRVRRGAADKTMFFSEDLRGSHDYSADADSIYAQFPDPQQPTERLQLFVVKARYGKKTFPDGQMKTLLEIKPAISLIRSAADYYSGADKSEVLKIAAKDEGDLDLSTSTPAKDDSTNVSMDDIFADVAGKSEEKKSNSVSFDEMFNDL